MAKQDEVLQRHQRNLVKAATIFAQNEHIRSFKDPETGEIFLPNDPSFHKELSNILPDYADQDPYTMFKVIRDNQNTQRVQSYLNPSISSEEVEIEKKEEEKPEEEKEEKRPSYVATKPQQKEGAEKETPETPAPKPEEAQTEQTTEEIQPLPETVIMSPQQAQLNQPALDIQPEEVILATPPAEDSTQQVPKFDLKPLPFTPITHPQQTPPQTSDSRQTQPIQPTRGENTRPINPTPPPANRSQPTEPTTSVSSGATPILTRTSMLQTAKAMVTSPPVKRVAKEAAFQAQMATKKIIDKGIQVTGSFAKGSLETVGGLFQGGPVFDESIDNYSNPEENQYYPGTQATTGGRQMRMPRIPRPTNPGGIGSGGIKKSFFRSIAGRTVLISGISFLIYFVLFSGILESSAPLMNLGQSRQTQLASYNLGGVGYCDFTYRNKSVGIKSERLKRLFEEVGQLTGVPASVLASVAVHESPIFTLQAENDHDAFFNRGFSGVDCAPHFPTSPTGALGLMQIQAPSNFRPQNAPNYNPNAFSEEGVEIGLKFLNRSLASLTLNDFCDVRTNIILGAGVLMAKNGGTPPTTGAEVNDAVCGYYGQCEYGIYNYGQEVQRDFENCQAPPTGGLVSNSDLNASFCPIPNGTVTCGSQATPVNSCGHCGLNYGENMATCASFPATKFALDIAAPAGQKVVLPTLNGQGMRWEWKFEESKGVDAIQGYVGTDLNNGNKYLLQLHHTQSGSGKRGISFSGEQGGSVCSNCNHLHVQIGQGDSIGTINWLDAAQRFCQTQNSQSPI